MCRTCTFCTFLPRTPPALILLLLLPIPPLSSPSAPRLAVSFRSETRMIKLEELVHLAISCHPQDHSATNSNTTRLTANYAWSENSRRRIAESMMSSMSWKTDNQGSSRFNIFNKNAWTSPRLGSASDLEFEYLSICRRGWGGWGGWGTD